MKVGDLYKSEMPSIAGGGGAIGGRCAQEFERVRAPREFIVIDQVERPGAARTDWESIRLSMLMSRRCRCSRT